MILLSNIQDKIRLFVFSKYKRKLFVLLYKISNDSNGKTRPISYKNREILHASGISLFYIKTRVQ